MIIFPLILLILILTMAVSPVSDTLIYLFILAIFLILCILWPPFMLTTAIFFLIVILSRS